MNYEGYIASSAWRIKRQERLEIDGYKCVVCKGDGTEYRLEVHHITYDRLGHEDVRHDLMTVCSRCHDLFTEPQRRARYASRADNTVVQVTVSTCETRKDLGYGLANDSLQVDIRLSDARPQRTDCRSTQQVVEGDEGG